MSASQEKTTGNPGLLWGGVGILAGFGILAWQAYTWLQTGHWPNLTLATYIVPMESGSQFGEWLSKPDSWYGLHKIIRSAIGIPLGALIMLCSWGIMYAFED